MEGTKLLERKKVHHFISSKNRATEVAQEYRERGEDMDAAFSKEDFESGRSVGVRLKNKENSVSFTIHMYVLWSGSEEYRG